MILSDTQTAPKRSALTLSDRDVAEIQVFYDVARANGTHLYLKEAISFLHPEASEQEFLKAWSKCSGLSKRFEVRSGLILSRAENETKFMESYVEDKRRRAARNLEFAEAFARLAGGHRVRVFSVSGSSSYGSVSEQDDLDFFCITQKDSMWLFLTRSLLFARVFRFFNRDSPDLCFSCVMDEAFAEELFNQTRDALFARDALKTYVIQGSQFYNNLLQTHIWISKYFPKQYRARVEANASSIAASRHQEPNTISKIANLLLYYTVGKYLRTKANLKNRTLQKDGTRPRLFTAKIGRDCCIYESVHYIKLRHIYARLSETENSERLPFSV